MGMKFQLIPQVLETTYVLPCFEIFLQEILRKWKQNKFHVRPGFIEKYLPSILLRARVFVCVCIWDLYIPVMFSYLKRSEEDFRSPGSGVAAICDSSDTRTWNWTQVLYKSSKCSYLLNPLFSHIKGFIYLFVFKFYTGGNIYQNNVSVSKK